MTPLSVESVLAEILAACVGAYSHTDGAPELPDRRYVTHGPIVADDEQLVVSSAGLRTAKAFPGATSAAVDCAVVAQLDAVVEVWRCCWPMTDDEGHAPTADVLNEAGLKLARDVSTLWPYVAGLATAGGLVTGATCHDVALGTMTPQGPQGGMAGWRWPISVKLALP